MACHNQLSYLQQVSDLLQDKYKRLAARLGYIAKLIQLGQQVHTRGTDAPRLMRCKACHAPINFDNIRHEERWIHIKCSLCGLRRKYSILKDIKLYKRRPTRRQKKIRRADSPEEIEIIESLVQKDPRQGQQGQQEPILKLRQSERLKLPEDDEVQVISSVPKPSPRRLRPSTKLVTKATQQCAKSRRR